MKKPDFAWNLPDLDLVVKNGFTVMSTFSCGGGSSMGYKRAGYEVIAANDIDPVMEWHYKYNLHPQLYYLCQIKELLTAKLPDSLFSLDILDGSPPCSTFSMSGNREKDWGKKKKFREGQCDQVLSDLFFDYLDLANRLRPKVIIAENVKGLILGNAKGYAKLIMLKFREIGYKPQLFLVNSADCGVPQRRERVFFCALRNDINKPKLILAPTHKWITAKEAIADLELTEKERIETKPAPTSLKWWPLTKKGRSFKDAVEKIEGRRCFFNYIKLNDDMPSNTLVSCSSDKIFHWQECRLLSFREWKRLGSFPDDYYAKTDSIGKYMIGMSVPPKMTEYIAKSIMNQWLL